LWQTYCSMICRSDWRNTLLVITVIPKGSEWIKSTRTSDFVFLRALLMLVIWVEGFFMNLALLSLPIGMIICFLEGLFMVIWMWGLVLGVFLMMLLIWSIFFAPMKGNASLILIISDMLIFYFKAWVYDFGNCLELVASLLFLKYFEITLTSFWDLAEIGGGILSMFTRLGLLISLLFLLEASWIFRVNLATIFLLSVLDCLSAWRES